jgi:hypothetical protein
VLQSADKNNLLINNKLILSQNFADKCSDKSDRNGNFKTIVILLYLCNIFLRLS